MTTQNNNDFGSMFGQMFGIPIGGQNASGDPSANTTGGPTYSSGTGSGGGGTWGAPTGGGSTLRETVAKWSKRVLIILGAIVVVVLAFCYWWFHPAINLHSTSVWNWITLIAIIVAVVFWIMSIRHKDRKKLFYRLMIIPLAAVVAYIIGGISGMALIPGNAQRYASVLETTDGNFAEDITEVDYSSIPVIDRDSAILLGNRAMGAIPEYVSQFEISDLYSQINYQGRPVRVSPLVYADFFKWWINRSDGIPAYVIVDMTTQEVEIVKLDEPIMYSESEPFTRNIDRYVQLNYPTYMFDQKSFELDEDGTPWWVYPVQKRTVGLFEGTTISRVVLVNACTGETQDYAIEDCPSWVDRAYPSDLIVEQYNWSGKYSDGWLNSWIGQVGVVQVTKGSDGNYGYNYIAQDDDVYLYSGVSSVTSDNSIIGFILVNQRTSESRFYMIAGATEESAMKSAEGQVQDLKYTSTFPLLLNIEDQPTYFMALKDAAGLVKMYAMINIERYQTVAVGDTVAQCQAAYVQLLADNGIISDAEIIEELPEEEMAIAEGVIETITSAVIEGNSHFYVVLEGDDAIYDFSLPGLIEIVAYQVGDEIAFTYVETDDRVQAVGGFVEDA